MLIHIRPYFIFAILTTALALNATTKVHAGDFRILNLYEIRVLILSYLSAKDLLSLMEALNIGVYQNVSMHIKMICAIKLML